MIAGCARSSRVVDGVGVAKPGGVARQLAEAREALRVEPVVRPISVFEGSSSSSTTTIGAWLTPPIVRACASSGNATFEIGSVNRNSARKISGAGDSTRRNESARAPRARTAPRRRPRSAPTARSAPGPSR